MEQAMVGLDSSRAAAAGWNCAATRSSTLVRWLGAGHPAVLLHAGATVQTWDDPLIALDWMQQHVHGQRPQARWIGFVSYDLGRIFEKIPPTARDDLSLPLFDFAYVEPDSIVDGGREPVASLVAANDPLGSTFTREQYLHAVGRVIEYIRAGDVFQVNLSQRFSGVQRLAAAAIYSRLRERTPGVFDALLQFPDFALISNSPELFLQVHRDPATGQRRVITRPIKGTRPRGTGMDALLRGSPKDQAELNMIIDLCRNDLGRVCRVGSIRVSQPREIEEHPTVYHAAATIEGALRDDVTFVDLLRATFPGGSVTGAPKIRAMQIIEELEPVRRGPYCGAIGYLAGDGTMQFSMAIRTMLAKDGLIHIPVGGGIVADSDPLEEYQETLVKARAMIEAAGFTPIH